MTRDKYDLEYVESKTKLVKVLTSLIQAVHDLLKVETNKRKRD